MICLLGTVSALPAAEPGMNGSFQNQQQAFALSRGLPDVLSNRDQRLYEEIFRLQEKGDWGAADQRIAQLGDERLMNFLLSRKADRRMTGPRQPFEREQKYVRPIRERETEAKRYALEETQAVSDYAEPC